MAKTNVLTRAKKKRARALYESNQLEDAATLYSQVLKTNRRDVEAWQMLGMIYWTLGRIEDAREPLQNALTIRPDHHELNYQLGCILLALGQKTEAISYIQRALNIEPDFFDAHLALGNALAKESRLEDAVARYRKALQSNPAHPAALSNLGNVVADQGEIDEAEACWRQALTASPNYVGAHSNLLLCLNYNPKYGPEKLYQEHLEWAHRHEKSLIQGDSHPNPPDPERRLRIGYVTPDLREHSVAYFVEPLFAHLATDEFETFCYSDVAIADQTTNRLQPLVGHYRCTAGWTDDQVANRIRTDRIDLLVDLAGHSAGHRLLVFARKPAPVQITYLGYPNTTGMTAIDYRLTDARADPPGLTEKFYTETLYRLPHGFLCYTPSSEAPPVGPPPFKTAGHITFGALNYVGKTTSEAIASWAEIMHAVPESRMILKNKSFTDKATAKRYQDMFAARGIEADRIELIGLTKSKREHLNVYNRIDIALDTFPYNGTTTTCDTLWMGVPVITSAGEMHAGRVGVSLLSQIGLDELVAESPEDYVALAIRLANESPRLSQLRGTLRERMAGSSLCDKAAFGRDMAFAYRVLWQRWCERKRD